MDTTSYALTSPGVWVDLSTTASLTDTQSYWFTVEGAGDIEIREDATQAATTIGGHTISRENGLTWTESSSLKTWVRAVGANSVIVVSDA